MLPPEHCLLVFQEQGTRVPVDANGNAVGQLRAEMRQEALAFGSKASGVHAGAFTGFADSPAQSSRSCVSHAHRDWAELDTHSGFD